MQTPGPTAPGQHPRQVHPAGPGEGRQTHQAFIFLPLNLRRRHPSPTHFLSHEKNRPVVHSRPHPPTGCKHLNPLQRWLAPKPHLGESAETSSRYSPTNASVSRSRWRATIIATWGTSHVRARQRGRRPNLGAGHRHRRPVFSRVALRLPRPTATSSRSSSRSAIRPASIHVYVSSTTARPGTRSRPTSSRTLQGNDRRCTQQRARHHPAPRQTQGLTHPVPPAGAAGNANHNSKWPALHQCQRQLRRRQDLGDQRAVLPPQRRGASSLMEHGTIITTSPIPRGRCQLRAAAGQPPALTAVKDMEDPTFCEVLPIRLEHQLRLHGCSPACSKGVTF